VMGRWAAGARRAASFLAAGRAGATTDFGFETM
jgi:hypothetical protein